MKKQNRSTGFLLKVTPEEREKIRILAEALRRSQSDAIRVVVLEAVEKLGNQAAPKA